MKWIYILHALNVGMMSPFAGVPLDICLLLFVPWLIVCPLALGLTAYKIWDAEDENSDQAYNR